MSESQVVALIDDSLPANTRAAIEAHLDRCAECLELVTLATRAASRDPDPDDDDDGDRDGDGDGVGDRNGDGDDDGDGDRDGDGDEDTQSGRFVGRYELGVALGAGGMGVVYRARDAQLGRDVAIKLVHPRMADDSMEAQIGLLREAQAMARITHPNVLTVYDTGVVDEAIFVAVELVPGETLASWLDEPRPWRQVASVMLQAARGLEAAHAAKLIHRDFKPSNVLLGRDGRVRVFDFGVARFVDAEARRELAGTPLYWSPEQQRGEVADARADQYAFAITLHEALFRRLPEDGAIVQGTTKGVPSWLVDILRRALATDRERRYPSMAEVIAALERGLARRSRMLIAGAVAFAACASIAFAWAGYARGEAGLVRCRGQAGVAGSWTELERERIAAAFHATKLPYADQTWQHVAHELGRVADDWDAQHRDACVADTAERLACLDHERIVFDAIIERLASADRSTVSSAHLLLASLPDVGACAHPDRALTWPDDHVERARVAAQLRAQADVASLANDGHVQLAAQRQRAMVNTAKTPRERATADFLAGHVAGLTGRFDDAITEITRAMWAAEAAGDDELVVTAASELLYLVGTRMHRPADARWFVDLARASADRVGSPTARSTASRAIGALELTAGHFEAAHKHLVAARELASDPVQVALIDVERASAESQRGHHAAAHALIQSASDTLARELGATHPRYGQSLNNLGNNLMDLGKLDDAADAFARSIATLERAYGPDHPDIAKVLSNAANVHLETGHLDRARELLLRSIRLLESGDPVLLASSLDNLGEVRRLQGANDEAEALYTRALASRQKVLSENHPKVTKSFLSLAGISLIRKNVSAARTWCDRAARSAAGSDVQRSSMMATIETCRGEVEILAGNRAAAVPILEHALELHATAEDPAERGDTEWALARALPASAKTRALALARSAVAGFAHQHAYRDEDIAEVTAWLAANTSGERPARSNAAGGAE